MKKHEEVVQTESPEDKIFDKAEEAESIENRKERITEIETKLKTLNEELKTAEEEDQKTAINARIEKWTAVKTKLQEKIDIQQEDMNSKK